MRGGRGVCLVERPQRFEPPAHGTDITDLERRVAAQFALHIEQVLDGIRCAPVVDVGQAVWLREQISTVGAASQASEWHIPRQVDIAWSVDVPAPACKVAGHVKARVARVLSIEHPSARLDHPLGTRVPGNAEPGCKVRLVIGHEPLTEPAIPRNLDRRVETEGNTFVEVPRSRAHESWVTAHVCYVRSRI